MNTETQSENSNLFSVFSPVTKSWTETLKDGSDEERYFQVTVSGLTEDRDGEVMDVKAIEDMTNQFKSGKIPLFPNHGRDPQTGERVYRWQDIMGVWVDAKMDGENLVATARLNKAHPDSTLLWDYLQNKMPVGFSIGGKPTEIVEEVVNG